MNIVKDGVKTVEFWVMVLGTIAVSFWPNFPKDSFIALAAWVVGRSAQKFFGLVGPDGKPSWQTSEFWVSIIYAVVAAVFPDMPQDSLYGVLAWVAGRTGVKLTAPKQVKSTNGGST